jgi:dihydrofolate reductase
MTEYTEHTITITDRSYQEWTIHPSLAELSLDPVKHKLFSRDKIAVSPQSEIKLVYSPTRNIATQIPGVLLLETQQTFGRTENKKRLLYKCIPNDPQLPFFLIPYDIKLGFSKDIKNRYVLFTFDHWNQIHPRGILSQNLGEVNSLDVFCEYQLYCRNIHTSISEFGKKVHQLFSTKPANEYIREIRENPRFQISTEAKDAPYIFTIDPENSTDLDDAFSMIQVSPTITRITIYIANVYVLLETLQLWDAITRVSTIYLPDAKRTMLPPALSDICSLLEGKRRFAFCMQIDVDQKDGLIKDSVRFYNTEILVSRNFVYESQELLHNPQYNSMLQLTKSLNSDVSDSHGVVSYWMVLMNSICGENLDVTKTEAFFRKNTSSPYQSSSLASFFSNWKNTSGYYSTTSCSSEPYIHITSPIRRLVDVVNQGIYMRQFGVILDAPCTTKWMDSLDSLNADIRSIRKVQMDCELMRQCNLHPEWMKTPHQGIVVDSVLREDGKYAYTIYLSNLKVLSRITIPEKLSEYSTHMFTLFVFEDEHKLQNKIRLQLCPDPTLDLIVAMNEQNVIGVTDSTGLQMIPWHIPEDLQYFREMTLGHILIMGRKTFDSLPKKPLPKRVHIVITHYPSKYDEKYKDTNTVFFTRFDQLDMVISQVTRQFPEKRIFVCGGEDIYRKLLPRCNRLFISSIEYDVCAPENGHLSRFPDKSEWISDYKLQTTTTAYAERPIQYLVYEKI